MQNRLTTLRGAARRAQLPAIAVLALFAAIPAAQADQQATTAEMDNALSWQAASGRSGSDAYAQGSHRDRDHGRHHAYRYR
jgi:hypothetical protein